MSRRTLYLFAQALLGRDPVNGTEVINSVGSSNNHGDFTNGSAFFGSSVDLSPYASPNLYCNVVKYFIEVTDTGGKKATGYIAGVGTGSTVNIVSAFKGTTRNWTSIDGGFDSAHIASWSIKR